MVLVTEEPQKFQNRCCIENLDTLTVCQFPEHSIHDHQAAAKDGVVADDKFYAIHRFRCKKKHLGASAFTWRVPRRRGLVQRCTAESLCYAGIGVKLFQEAARRLRPRPSGCRRPG